MRIIFICILALGLLLPNTGEAEMLNLEKRFYKLQGRADSLGSSYGEFGGNRAQNRTSGATRGNIKAKTKPKGPISPPKGGGGEELKGFSKRDYDELGVSPNYKPTDVELEGQSLLQNIRKHPDAQYDPKLGLTSSEIYGTETDLSEQERRESIIKDEGWGGKEVNMAYDVEGFYKEVEKRVENKLLSERNEPKQTRATATKVDGSKGNPNPPGFSTPTLQPGIGADPYGGSLYRATHERNKLRRNPTGSTADLKAEKAAGELGLPQEVVNTQGVVQEILRSVGAQGSVLGGIIQAQAGNTGAPRSQGAGVNPGNPGAPGAVGNTGVATNTQSALRSLLNERERRGLYRTDRNLQNVNLSPFAPGRQRLF